MTVTNSEIGAYVDSLSDIGTPASGDELLVYDVSAATAKKVLASEFMGGGGTPVTIPARFALPSAVAASSISASFATAPSSGSKLYALISSVVSTAPSVSSITQTNVTWTLLHKANNGTSAVVEIWKGVPSGAPGTSVTITLSGSGNATAAVIEWTGTQAGTLDASADNTGSGTSADTGVATASAGALCFAVHGVANGGVDIQWVGAAPWQNIKCAGGSYAAFGYCVNNGGGELRGRITNQSSAAWANTVVSVI